ncbi:RNA binding protein Rnp24 [Aspergillus granulosus]|uniref:RNA binding protein Rnp24 n=1 Tax=Aspergillus granulosus TaxID=176169 RepID=A0ABR4HLN7_9EURO
MAAIGEGNHKKRKLLDVPEIEIDVSAPEPPSKKALRKAKKKAAAPDAPIKDESSKASNKPDSEKPGEAQAAPQKRSEYGIWIGNLGFAVTKDDLRRFLTTNCSFTDATITRIHLPKGQERNGKAQNKGFAYVDFSNPKAVQEAMQLSEQLLSGRRVLIKDAKNFQGRPERQEGGKDATAAAAPGRPPSKRVFVGNLGFDATKEILEEHFSKCGIVSNVHLATFQDSGKCKGYAWVEFEDLSAAEVAVKGFKLVAEDDDEGESESETAKRGKPHKPRQRKVWVNQVLGRRMRIEFAEDATTRYNKRFGKNGEKNKNETNHGETELGDFEEDTAKEKPQHKQTARAKPAKPEYSRYDESTVQKLSGAIVEAQGKKTTFD